MQEWKQRMPNFSSHAIWLIIGFIGQFLFSMRFLWQWFQSEKQGKSVIPVNFWYFSLAGGIVLSVYAIHLRDPVYILGQTTGLFVYFRNLYFIMKEKKETTHVA
jgi:lipid-A-disaccharide synthase-like uncharacterized protein